MCVRVPQKCCQSSRAGSVERSCCELRKRQGLKSNKTTQASSVFGTGCTDGVVHVSRALDVRSGLSVCLFSVSICLFSLSLCVFRFSLCVFRLSLCLCSLCVQVVLVCVQVVLVSLQVVLVCVQFVLVCVQVPVLVKGISRRATQQLQ